MVENKNECYITLFLSSYPTLIIYIQNRVLCFFPPISCQNGGMLDFENGEKTDGR